MGHIAQNECVLTFGSHPDGRVTGRMARGWVGGKFWRYVILAVNEVHHTVLFEGQNLRDHVFNRVDVLRLGPVVPIFLRHQKPGVGEVGLSVGVIPAHVVGMDVGEDHDVHRLAVDPFPFHVVQEIATFALHTRVHQDQLARGVDGQRAPAVVAVFVVCHQFRVFVPLLDRGMGKGHERRPDGQVVIERGQFDVAHVDYVFGHFSLRMGQS